LSSVAAQLVAIQLFASHLLHRVT